ncbi:MAG: HEAT repeat domain-containing protein [Planctomycetota bacterium]
MLRNAQRGSEVAQLFAILICLLTLGRDPLQGQESRPELPLDLLLADEDPILRGEAAIALSLSGQPAQHRRLVAVAEDRAIGARIRGILSVGFLAAPGAEDFLGKVLEESDLGSAEHMAAALALGAIPDDHPTPAIDSYLAVAIGGSYRRHGPSLCALLYGLSLSPHPSRRHVLETLMGDASNRDELLRGMTVMAMAEISPDLVLENMADLLRDRSESTRLASLQAILSHDVLLEEDDYVRVSGLAKKARRVDTRIAATEVLIRHRRPIVLDIANRSLESPAPKEAAVAVRAILNLGGGALREALEERIMSEESANIKTRMLSEWKGQATPRFIESCFELATDPRNSNALRSASAIVVATAGQERINPTLRRLVSKTRDPDLLSRLLARIRASEGGEDHILALYPSSPEESLAFQRQLKALLGMRQSAAEDLLARALEDSRFSADYRAKLLASWSRRELSLPKPPGSGLPKEIGEILNY